MAVCHLLCIEVTYCDKLLLEVKMAVCHLMCFEVTYCDILLLEVKMADPEVVRDLPITSINGTVLRLQLQAS